MLSIRQKKELVALQQKKVRTSTNSFVVEGVKMVEELLQSDYKIKDLYATASWISENKVVDCVGVSEKELAQISSLKSPNKVLAVVEQKTPKEVQLSQKLTLALDKLQDPGNLGTIIRTADWFGIETIVCSTDAVDVYNPKVLQATMGSFFRVNIIYTDLPTFFRSNKDLTVYGALLNGENVYQKTVVPKAAILLMGNESQGISEELLPFVTEKIKIPNFGKAESLNVATATAILCSEFSRT